MRPNSGAATAIFVSWSLLARLVTQYTTVGPSRLPRTGTQPGSRAPREDACPPAAGRYLSRLYLSVKYRPRRKVRPAPSPRTDAEVFRDLGNTLGFGRGPAIDLPESESIGEPRVQAEPAREPRIQGEDRLSMDQLLRGRGHEDASMFPRQVEQDSALGQLKKAFVHPGCEAQVHERVPGEAIAQDRAAEELFRQRNFAKITQEVVERHGPCVQMQQPGVSAQIHDDVIMVAQPDAFGESRKSKEAEDPEGDDPRRTHTHDSRLDPAPSEPIHDPPRDRRLPRTVRPHDRINPRGPRGYRPRSRDAVVRPRVEGLHGKTSSRFGRSLKTVPDGGLLTAVPLNIPQANAIRGPRQARNVKIIGLGPALFAPVGRSEDFSRGGP